MEYSDRYNKSFSNNQFQQNYQYKSDLESEYERNYESTSSSEKNLSSERSSERNYGRNDRNYERNERNRNGNYDRNYDRNYERSERNRNRNYERISSAEKTSNSESREGNKRNHRREIVSNSRNNQRLESYVPLNITSNRYHERDTNYSGRYWENSFEEETNSQAQRILSLYIPYIDDFLRREQKRKDEKERKKEMLLREKTSSDGLEIRAFKIFVPLELLHPKNPNIPLENQLSELEIIFRLLPLDARKEYDPYVKFDGKLLGIKEILTLEPTDIILEEKTGLVQLMFTDGFRFRTSVEYTVLQRDDGYENPLTSGSIYTDYLKDATCDENGYIFDETTSEYYKNPTFKWIINAGDGVFEAIAIKKYSILSNNSNPIPIPFE